MVNEIFISYRSSESEFALNIATVLNDANLPIWMDKLSGIEPGDDWVMALQNGVTNSTGMVCCISPAYVISKYCRRELARADSLGKPIIPLLLETVSDEQWPIELQTRHYIDFRNWSEEDGALTESAIVLVERAINYMKAEVGAKISLPQPSENRATEIRAFEDEMSRVDNELSYVDALRRKHLQQQLDMMTKQYESISEAVLLSIDPSLTPKFEMQLERMIVKTKQVQTQIKNLSGK